VLTPLVANDLEFGESSEFGEGSVSSYVRLDRDGNVESYGLKMTGPALNGLSEDPEAERQSHLHMPEGVAGVPVEHVDIHFLPFGHPGGPGNTYWAVPHFDFHFFLKDAETSATYTDPSLAFNPLADAYVPESYILAPDSFVPGEGVHWVNPAEFEGPYTTNFIYGSYDSEMTFLEPMEDLSYLKDMREGNVGDFTGAIGSARSYQKAGLYPQEYSISYDAEEDAFYIELQNLVMRSSFSEGQLPGDCNQDGEIDIADGICVLGYLFGGLPRVLPCGDGTDTDPGNVELIDSNGSGEIDLSDAIRIFRWNFFGGPGHALGSDCVFISGCPAGECTI
jgi:hypothetical protein